MMRFIMLLALVMCCAAPVDANRQPASTQTRKPNIVFVLMDDMGYANLGCYGANDIRTTNIDRLAKQGMCFTDMHSPSSVCTPTHWR